MKVEEINIVIECNQCHLRVPIVELEANDWITIKSTDLTYAVIKVGNKEFVEEVFDFCSMECLTNFIQYKINHGS